MNLYAVIILAALLVSYFLEIVSDLLNLKSLKEDPPEDLKDVFDLDLYKKSQKYTRERTNFGFVSSTVNLAALLIFWFYGGFNALDIFLRQFHWPELITGIAYIGILGFGASLLSLPFKIYSTFVIEEKFGFNKTTWKTFVLDFIKGTALSIVLGAPILLAILWFFQVAGPAAWLYGWITITIVSFLIQYIAPVWIMPLFNKFTHLEEGSLKQAIVNYTHSVDFPLKEIVVMDGSKRSAKENAFFTGWGKNKRIALFDTLINKYSVDELVSVVAHEVGHFKLKHIFKGHLLSIINTGVMFYLLSIFISSPGLFEAFGMQHISVYAGLIFFGMLYTPIEMLLSIGLNSISRKHEFEADRFSAETTGHQSDLISALKKLTAHNLANLTPHPVTVFLYYSHPPLKERVAALKSLRRTAIEAKPGI